MALIDGNGRIAGIVNIIDLFVILLLVLFVYGLVSYLNSAAQSPVQANTEIQHPSQHATILLKLLYLELAGQLSIGENETYGNQTYGVIRNISVFNTNVANSKLDGNSNVYVTIDVQGEMRNGTFFFKDGPLKAGQQFTLSTDMHELQGIITHWELS